MVVERSPGLPEARAEAAHAAKSRPVGWLGRAGLLAQGISYGIVGILAIRLALGEGGEAEGRVGALRTLAGSTSGAVLLALLALGFAGYAVWRLSEAFFDRGHDGSDVQGLAARAAAAAKAAVYLGLTAATAALVVGGRKAGSRTDEDEAAAGVFAWPGGRWLVLAVGVGILAVALYHLYRGVTRGFMDDLKRYRMSEAEQVVIERLGVVGFLARALVFALVGWFLVKAALEYDPEEAIGLDGALAKLASAPHGSAALGAAAGGLLAYGVFCVAQARYRRV